MTNYHGTHCMLCCLEIFSDKLFSLFWFQPHSKVGTWAGYRQILCLDVLWMTSTPVSFSFPTKISGARIKISLSAFLSGCWSSHSHQGYLQHFTHRTLCHSSFSQREEGLKTTWSCFLQQGLSFFYQFSILVTFTSL